MYPNLRMCLNRDSGLFMFLTQVLIWSYSFAVLSQLYWAWIKDKEYLSLSLSHTRTHTCVQYPDCFQFLQYLTACLTILCRFLSYTTCQTHFGSKLAASLSAATYSSSRFSCAMFWSASVTKDCKQSRSSFELREVLVSKAFLYVSFRVSNKEAPLQIPLTELP